MRQSPLVYVFRLESLVLYGVTVVFGKEVQDTSCRESGGVSTFEKPPKIGRYRGVDSDCLRQSPLVYVFRLESLVLYGVTVVSGKEVQDTSCWGSGGIPQL